MTAGDQGGASAAQPANVDLSADMLPAKDQGARGTCLAFAVTAAHELARSVAGGTSPEALSEETLHWGAKQIDGDTDEGTSFDAGAAALGQTGQPAEHHWPYDANRDGTDASYVPPSAALDPANRRRAGLSRVNPTIDHLRAELADGRAVAIGIPLWDGFYLPDRGELSSPAQHDLNGALHAVVAVGYDDGAGRIVIRNSWGSGWGEQGHARLPYRFVLDHALEAWLIADVLDH